jgi:hypothetical protein
MKIYRELIGKAEQNNENFKTVATLVEIQTVYLPNVKRSDIAILNYSVNNGVKQDLSRTLVRILF